MIYPKNVVSYVLDNSDLSRRFGKILVPESLNSKSASIEESSDEFELWMFTDGIGMSSEIRNYLFFISAMRNIFAQIYLLFNKKNPGRENRKDAHAVATSPEEMLYIARYLYYLRSHGIQGDVLECGCFKGYSTCCLSWACDYLGLRLFVADSFQGLPDDKNEPYYEAHDFQGTMEEVRSNLLTFGRIAPVEFIRGWFKDSLVGFNHPIALLWMDVDLYSSTMDVLTNVRRCLVPNSVIFSHEFSPWHLRNDQIVPKTEAVTQALYDFIHKEGISHRAKFLKNNLGIVVLDSQEAVRLSRRKQSILMNLQTISTMGYPPFMNSISKRSNKVRSNIELVEGTAWKVGQIVEIWNSEASISGWAVDSSSAMSASGVYAKIGDLSYFTPCNQARQDVADSYQNQNFLDSGFEISIPINRLPQGINELSIWILSHDRSMITDSGFKVMLDIRRKAEN